MTTRHQASTPAPREPDFVFYDGHCGLCHRSVSFLARRDPDGHRFRFAPLGGEEIARRLDEGVRANLPDSVAVLTADGELLTRSDAAAHLLQSLGGGWGGVGTVLRLIPRPVRDLGYALVARVRARLFGRREAVCPVLPAELRGRFLP